MVLGVPNSAARPAVTAANAADELRADTLTGTMKLAMIGVVEAAQGGQESTYGLLELAA